MHWSNWRFQYDMNLFRVDDIEFVLLKKKDSQTFFRKPSNDDCTSFEGVQKMGKIIAGCQV